MFTVFALHTYIYICFLIIFFSLNLIFLYRLIVTFVLVALVKGVWLGIRLNTIKTHPNLTTTQTINLLENINDCPTT